MEGELQRHKKDSKYHRACLLPSHSSATAPRIFQEMEQKQQLHSSNRHCYDSTKWIRNYQGHRSSFQKMEVPSAQPWGEAREGIHQTHPRSVENYQKTQLWEAQGENIDHFPLEDHQNQTEKLLHEVLLQCQVKFGWFREMRADEATVKIQKEREKFSEVRRATLRE